MSPCGTRRRRGGHPALKRRAIFECPCGTFALTEPRRSTRSTCRAPGSGESTPAPTAGTSKQHRPQKGTRFPARPAQDALFSMPPSPRLARVGRQGRSHTFPGNSAQPLCCSHRSVRSRQSSRARPIGVRSPAQVWLPRVGRAGAPQTHPRVVFKTGTVHRIQIDEPG